LPSIFIINAGIDITFPSPKVLKIIFLFIAVAISIVGIVKARHHIIKNAAKTKYYLAARQRIETWRIRLFELLNEGANFFLNNKKRLAWTFLFFHASLGDRLYGIFPYSKFLGIKTSMLHAIFLDMGVILFKAAGAFVPAQIGVEEYGNKVMLSLVGITGVEVWITVSLIRRLRQLFWIALGLIFYLLIYKKHRNALVGT
jgi:hypothetical protein